MTAARVDGFCVVSTGAGYLAAIRNPGEAIDGSLVFLNGAAYRLADGWEDLDVYSRVAVAATVADGSRQPCWIYAGRDVRGPVVADGRLADRPRAEILADIRRFRAAFEATRRP